jgi:hypothetical protein
MDKKPSPNLLMRMELETLEEAREWGRRRLEEKLQKLIEEQGAISPPQRPAAEKGPPPKVQAENGRGRNHR